MSDFSEDDLQRIKDVIASGTEREEYRDRSVKYRSLDDLLRTHNVIERQVRPVTNRIYQTMGKGL